MHYYEIRFILGIKHWFQFRKKSMCYTLIIDSILKSRGITLLTKIHLAKAVIFQVVMYGCES